jgi:CSLREA domain-containing protein
MAFSVFASDIQGATFTVTKIIDTDDGVCNNDCSLREAIGAANAAADADIITFDPHVFSTPKTITVFSQLLIADSTSLQIVGPGSAMLKLSGNNSVRILFVEPHAVVTISGVTIAEGKLTDFGEGAGIRNQLGTLTINNSTFTGNVTGPMGYGAGIYNYGGVLNINSCTFTNNSAGGAAAIASGNPGVGTPDSLTITSSSFSGNTASNVGGAVGGGDMLNISNSTFNNNQANWGGALGLGLNSTLNGVTFTNNSALTDGGGAIIGGGTLLISGCNFNNNHAKTHGGAIFLDESARPKTVQNTTISLNTADLDGGGVYNRRSPVTFYETTFSSNVAVRNGGAYYHTNPFASTNFFYSTITANTARDGGGLFNDGGEVNLNSTLVVGNNAPGSGNGGGGGVRNGVATLNVTNSTITGNTTAINGGGIANGGTVNLANATISGNQAASGGGVYNANTWTVRSKHSIIANNLGNSEPDFRGALNSQGYNLIRNTAGMTVTGATVGNKIGVDPRLVPLRNNGGATETMALQPGSPAIDAGDPNSFPTFDQRDVLRAQDGNFDGVALPDIGAYERRIDNTFTVTSIADGNDGLCNADCTLRDAIAAANASIGDSAVFFEPKVFGMQQTITLTLGELRITVPGTLVVLGRGSGFLTVSGNNSSRVFFLDEQRAALISGLKVTGGNGSGSTHTQMGGGIFNNGGYLELKGLIVSNNSVGFNPGAIGGGVNNTNGTLTVTGSTISANGAFYGGGLYNSGDGAVMEVNNSSVLSNTAGEGAGIYNRNVTEINNSLIDSNASTTNGGGINTLLGTLTVRGSRISDNTVQNGNGGGIFSNFNNIKVTLTDTVVFHNRIPGSGGGIAGSGAWEISRSTIAKNQSLIAGGGGVYAAGIFTITESTISENTATHGGGIVNRAGLTITNSTVSTNSVTGPGGGGGIYNDISGGGDTLNLVHVTVAKNTAQVAAGVRNETGTLNSRNSIFADNTSTNSAPDFFGTLTSQGYNLLENPSGATVGGVTTGNIIGQDPLLGALIVHGGPTATHLLLRGSPAIDQADPSGLIPTDQRGFPRPKDGDRNGTLLPDIGAVERNPLLDGTVLFDYDGDGKADVSVFRPSEGNWYIQNSSTMAVASAHFGLSGDLTAPGDFDGDGKADISVYRPSEGNWYRLNSSDGSFFGTHFGTAEDKPAVGDFDGDGKADISVYRPSEGNWYRLNSSDGSFFGTHFGAAEDKPTVGDFDGDGKADTAVFRPSEGNWYRLNSSDGSFFSTHFGVAEDKPAVGDFDGDGKTDISVFRPSEGNWYRLNSSNGSFFGLHFGIAEDKPVPADFDGDGKADVAVFRPSEGNWYIFNSTTGFLSQHFGATEDTPTPNSFVY